MARRIAVVDRASPQPLPKLRYAKARARTPLPAGAQQRGRHRLTRAIRPPFRRALVASLLATPFSDTNGARYHDATRWPPERAQAPAGRGVLAGPGRYLSVPISLNNGKIAPSLSIAVAVLPFACRIVAGIPSRWGVLMMLCTSPFFMSVMALLSSVRI